MSHLLYLNSRDNYPNKCPHICLHLTVKQHPTARGGGSLLGLARSADAYYTDRHRLGKGLISSTGLPVFPSTLTQRSKANHLKMIAFLARKPARGSCATAKGGELYAAGISGASP